MRRYSTTFGTTIMLSRCAGAFRNAAATASPGSATSADAHVMHRKSMSRRLDAGDIDPPELLDVTEHTAELRGETSFLLRRQGQAREFGDAIDVEIGGLGHGYFRRCSPTI